MKPIKRSIEQRKDMIQFKRRTTSSLIRSGLLCSICKDLHEICLTCTNRLKNRRCRACGELMRHDYYYHAYCRPDSSVLDLGPQIINGRLCT